MKGKKIINADGNEIGVVSGIRNGVAYVDPDPGITDKVMSRLGWGDTDDDDYRLHPEKIDRVTDDEIHLRRDL
ncbi:PRC-barrel domain containing protein [Halorarius litoreus]|uniref:PRC-barrel domain containing protein n=1 Tax=Halorarius litoreus TaxID=2962676 RepID=UPI0020CE17EA|nr:PRC-barrel domain containing protein [Halorarius litoreus]